MSRTVIVAGNFPEKDKDFVSFARNVEDCLKANSHFPSPPVTSAALGLLIDAYEPTVGKKGPGVANDRKAKRTKVENALRLDEAYVESVLATMAPEDIPVAAESSGYSEKKKGAHVKLPHSVKRGATAGSVIIEVKALGRHGTIQYCHRYSVDGGKTWIDVPPTIDTTVTVTGLPLGVEVWFEFRTLKKGVYSDWSQTLKYLVH